MSVGKIYNRSVNVSSRKLLNRYGDRSANINDFKLHKGVELKNLIANNIDNIQTKLNDIYQTNQQLEYDRNLFKDEVDEKDREMKEFQSKISEEVDRYRKMRDETENNYKLELENLKSTIDMLRRRGETSNIKQRRPRQKRPRQEEYDNDDNDDDLEENDTEGYYDEADNESEEEYHKQQPRRKQKHVAKKKRKGFFN